MLRDFLKHSKHYDISTALVKEIVSPEQTVVSAGVIYFSEDALRAEQERLKAQRSLHEDVKVKTAKAGKQDEVTRICIKLHDDPDIKQYGRINIKQHYLDPTKSYQPIHDANININDRKARREKHVPDRNEPDAPFYQDLIAPFDVSHPALQSRLEHLYQHVFEDDKEYFFNLRAALRAGQ
ncbi:hypothetical protein EKO04_000385 [Ascochyta lentis]|uniref:Uncharacterized protein n=1 Tax=Ascochyta lentis TaxID=205686 RepID=A0A8H7MMY6_9PLEO|nr:hypothetical protein EKO04_000385 [Ascochyta lentis]